jgi:hypothetical protein
MKSRVRTISSLSLLLAFALLTALPGLALFKFDGTTRSLTENRDLADRPDVPRNREELFAWSGRFDAFVADHFGGRQTLVTGYNFLHVRMGLSPSPRALIGKKGWMFLEQTHLTDANRGALPLSEEQLEQLFASFELRQSFLDARGIAFMVMPVPDKHSMFPEFLPSSVEFVGASRLDQFRRAMGRRNFHFVDAYAALLAAKNAGDEIYFQTDSHWNSRGAWVAYQALMKRLHESGYQGGTLIDESNVEFIRLGLYHPTDIVKNLLGLSGWIPEAHGIRARVTDSGEVRAFRGSDGKEYDYLYSAPPGQEKKHFVRTEPRDGSRVLIYRDSYANAMLPFLVHSFDEVIYARAPKSMSFDPADIDRYDPDLVIYEFVERALFYEPDDSLLLAAREKQADGSLTDGGARNQ